MTIIDIGRKVGQYCIIVELTASSVYKSQSKRKSPVVTTSLSHRLTVTGPSERSHGDRFYRPQ